MAAFIPYLLAVVTLSDVASVVASSPSAVVNRKFDLKVIAVVGRNATLECPTKETDEHRVAWIKQESRTILSLHGELVTQSNRYAIVKKELGSFDLFISNVQESDAGTYICQINSSPMKNLVIFLYVVKSPSIRAVGSDHIEARIGQSVSMECVAEGIPRPEITWKKYKGRNGVLVARNTNVVVLHNVSTDDAGKYMCIANNGYPPSVSQKIRLSIMYKPQIQIAGKHLYANIFQISCHIHSYPYPHQIGIGNQDSNLVDFTRQIKEDVEVGYEILLTSTVEVSKPTDFDCIARNEVGEARRLIHFKGIPEDVETSTTTADPKEKLELSDFDLNKEDWTSTQTSLNNENQKYFNIPKNNMNMKQGRRGRFSKDQDDVVIGIRSHSSSLGPTGFHLLHLSSLVLLMILIY